MQTLTSIFLVFGFFVLLIVLFVLLSKARDIQDLKTTLASTNARLESMEKNNTYLNDLVDKRLEALQNVVDQRLQNTLESRLSSSFKQVGDQLESVYRQLGEVQSLAKGLGNLERVLSNVKTRGVWGELQAQRILEDILLPQQYEKNIATKKGSRDVVEFAVRLPGATQGSVVYLPIDSKFPREDYERIVLASEAGDSEAVKVARKALEVRILSEAKSICEKYIDVPNTTDFAILFLPTEGLYAEVLSIAGLMQKVQTQYHVMISGPSTLASLLNSLQMGFRTLAIERKSSEVWHILGEVKTEYMKFGMALDAVKKKISAASSEIDNAFTRHRAMERKLSDVEAFEPVEDSGEEGFIEG